MDAKELGKRIKNARTVSGMTQVELGEKIGITKQAVYKYESGESVPSAIKIAEISSALGVSVDTILSGAFVVNRLNQYVKDGKITINEIETIANVDYEQVSRWLRDVESPSDEQLAAIAKHLGIEMDDLLVVARSEHEQKSYLYGRIRGAFEFMERDNKKSTVENILLQFPGLNHKHPGRYLKMCIQRHMETYSGRKKGREAEIAWDRIEEYMEAIGPDALEYDVNLSELHCYGAALERHDLKFE